MKRIAGTLLACVFACNVTLCATAQEKQGAEPSKASSENQASTENMQPYLGVQVEPTHRALVVHLLHMLGEGRGVLITEVSDDSPAQKAGLERDDILTTYDGHPLYSPEQLIKLVGSDKPGQEVTLGNIHAGKQEQIKAILGEQRLAARVRPYRVFRPSLSGRDARPLTAEQQQARWLRFDAMTLTRDNKDNFKAEIKYRDDQGKVETRNFEGTREQLHKDIRAQKDLPTEERDHLLRALDLAREPFAMNAPAGQR